MFGLFKKKGEIKTVADIRTALNSHFELIESFEFRLLNKNNNNLHDDNKSIRMPELNNHTGRGAKTVASICGHLEGKFSGVGEDLKVQILDKRTNEYVHGGTARSKIAST